MRRAIPKDIREKVKSRFDGRCGYCGERTKLQVDHIQPVRDHWRNESLDPNREENLMPACFSCNNYKFTRSLDEFRRDLQEQVHRARQYSLNFRLSEKFGLVQEIKKPIVFHFEKGTGT